VNSEYRETSNVKREKLLIINYSINCLLLTGIFSNS